MSVGRLGIITEVTLKIVPQQAVQRKLLVGAGCCATAWWSRLVRLAGWSADCTPRWLLLASRPAN